MEAFCVLAIFYNVLVQGIMGNLTFHWATGSFHWVTGDWTKLIEQVTALGTGQEQEQEAGAGGRKQEQEQEAGAGGRRQEKEQEQGGLARGL